MQDGGSKRPLKLASLSPTPRPPKIVKRALSDLSKALTSLPMVTLAGGLQKVLHPFCLMMGHVNRALRLALDER